MEIKSEHHKTGGKFYFEIDGIEKAHLTYKVSNTHKIIIDHTEVDPSLKGQGIGYKLVESSVQYARENGLKIKATCSYANAVLNKKDEFKDVLA
ncbi:GNAT family N-acetyltransferase [Psychroserpens sp. AS72]|uniref:GNAT family N-acetyltransferase n=1 Tax=Psychroserpens sp. AS72 TaxID=3135775 RepID=UPI00317143AC